MVPSRQDENLAAEPWPRGGDYFIECLDAAGATFAAMGNQYGPAFPGDDNYQWCLCYGCGEPFQYWGSFGIVALDGTDAADLPYDELAAGPCPHCGGAGVPLELYGTAGMIGSSPRAFAALEALEPIIHGLVDGSLGVDEAAQQLRARGGAFTRLADWIEARPATTAVVVGVLGIVATLLGPAMQDQSDGGLDGPEIERIIDDVLKHHDHVAPREPTRERRDRAGTSRRQTYDRGRVESDQ
jgi:hypothetical protein